MRLTWLSAIEEVEQDISPGSLPLSAHMRENWMTGRSCSTMLLERAGPLILSTGSTWDERFFGERDEDVPTEELRKTRVQLLDKEERTSRDGAAGANEDVVVKETSLD